MMQYWSRQPDTEVFRLIFSAMRRLETVPIHSVHWEFGKEQLTVDCLVPLIAEYKPSEQYDMLLWIAERLKKRGWEIQAL